MLNIETIADNIINFKYDTFKYKMEYNTYYKNFIMFLRTSLIYTFPNSTMEFPQFKKQEIIEKLKLIDLEKFHKYIHQKNIFVTNIPVVSLYYGNKYNEIYCKNFYIYENKKIPKTNNIIILYMFDIHNRTIRYADLTKYMDLNFFIKKHISKRENWYRKEKLKKLKNLNK